MIELKEIYVNIEFRNLRNAYTINELKTIQVTTNPSKLRKYEKKAQAFWFRHTKNILKINNKLTI
jgi:hypothetical protein